MRPVREAVERQIVWRPRSLMSHVFDLVDADARDGEPYATLAWRPGFLMRGPAQAEAVDGRWDFRHRGFLRDSVLVLAPGGDAVLGTLRQHWRRGVLRMEDGREFVWRRSAFWSSTHQFEDGEGTPLVRFRHHFSFPRASTRVEVESAATGGARETGDAALLACLGWYLLLMIRRRVSAMGL